ncbi:ribosomal protein S18-alanine N-acetyltransferase [Enterococcus sp. LJL98]
MMKHKEDYPWDTLATRLVFLCESSYAYGSPWNHQQFLADFTSAHSQYLLYEMDGEIVGFVNYHQIFDESEINHVVVAASKQGQGIGQLLMQTLFEKMRQQKQRKIFLEVRASNLPAQALYQKQGFKKIAKRKGYYHAPIEDAWVMVKEVRDEKEK